jgi:hypothetical protein
MHRKVGVNGAILAGEIYDRTDWLAVCLQGQITGATKLQRNLHACVAIAESMVAVLSIGIIQLE